MCYLCNESSSKFCNEECKQGYIQVLDFLIANHKNTCNRDLTNKISLQDLREEAINIVAGGN